MFSRVEGVEQVGVSVRGAVAAAGALGDPVAGDGGGGRCSG